MLLRKLLPLLMILILPFLGSAQVTTSSIVGVVTSSAGTPIEGASITATHAPSGTVYRTISRSGGNFTIPNMRVGGPYTIVVTYVGLETQTYNDIYLQLGEDTKLTPVLIDKTATLSDVNVVTQKNSLIGKDKIGTSIQISPQQLQMMPTISRNYADFVRASPIAQVRSSSSDGSPAGISFGGASTRYNQFSIDGASATDIFGLSSQGTNGGQAFINPIPFESIDQLQVVLAPYDVTQSGFTGGGMNAVTKSGTNEFHGSAYGYFQNQGLVGKSMTTRSKYPDFSNWQYGASLGGAIIKDKLFFFANYEGLHRSQPIANQPGAAGTSSKIDPTVAESLRDYVKNNYGYDPGAVNGVNSIRKSNSVFARIDWNINDKNKLMIRDNYVNGSNYSISDNTTSMSFGNNGYTFSTKTNSVVAQLSSNISNRASNMLRLTYTTIRDKRDVGNPFPSVTINDAESGFQYKLGSDYSSQANSLNQNILTLTDNYNIYAGAHTITVGTDNMYYKTANVFLQGLYGDYTFNSLSGFMSDTLQRAMTQYQTTYSNDKNNPLGVADIKMGSFSLYAQDAWNIKSNFKVTYGLRADLTTFFNDPAVNATFNNSPMAEKVGVLNNQPPKASLIVSFCVGFNWDVFNNGQTQIRGGVGIFAGRVPMVWVSNQYSNTGVATTKYTAYTADIQKNNITFDPKNPYQGTPTTPPKTEVDVTARNFQAPRSLRANLALDQKLPWGIIGTIEGVYTKVIKDILYQDLNLVDPATMTLDLGNGVTRPFYGTKYDNTNFTNLLYLYNTNKGHAYNVYVKLEKPFSQGWYASISYSLGHSYGMNDGTSSTAASNWRYAYNINGLDHLTESRNNTDQGSRVLINIGKKFTYGNFATNLGLFYTGQSGQTVTYIVNGDLNGDDGSTATSVNTYAGGDIMYVPNSVDDFKATGTMTAQQQYDAWMIYVNSDPYLKKNLGKNLAKNGSRFPWENHVDFRFAEDWHVYKSHTLTLSVDIFNVGNLLNKNWGKAYFASNQELTPLKLASFTQNGTTVKPQYNFTTGVDQYTGKPWSYSDYLSRWSMQIGLHYSF